MMLRQHRVAVTRLGPPSVLRDRRNRYVLSIVVCDGAFLRYSSVNSRRPGRRGRRILTAPRVFGSRVAHGLSIETLVVAGRFAVLEELDPVFHHLRRTLDARGARIAPVDPARRQTCPDLRHALVCASYESIHAQRQQSEMSLRLLWLRREILPRRSCHVITAAWASRAYGTRISHEDVHRLLADYRPSVCKPMHADVSSRCLRLCQSHARTPRSRNHAPRLWRRTWKAVAWSG